MAKAKTAKKKAPAKKRVATKTAPTHNGTLEAAIAAAVESWLSQEADPGLHELTAILAIDALLATSQEGRWQYDGSAMAVARLLATASHEGAIADILRIRSRKGDTFGAGHWNAAWERACDAIGHFNEVDFRLDERKFLLNADNPVRAQIVEALTEVMNAGELALKGDHRVHASSLAEVTDSFKSTKHKREKALVLLKQIEDGKLPGGRQHPSWPATWHGIVTAFEIGHDETGLAGASTPLGDWLDSLIDSLMRWSCSAEDAHAQICVAFGVLGTTRHSPLTDQNKFMAARGRAMGRQRIQLKRSG